MTLPLLINASSSDQPITLNHPGGVWAISFSPSDQFIASASIDSTIKLWNAESGAEIATLEGHSSAIWCVAFSPDGAMLASGSSDETIMLWHVESRVQAATLMGYSGVVLSLSFSPDGAFLASGSTKKTIQLWDLKTGASIRTMRGHSGDVRSVAFSPDGKIIASGCHDYTIRLWDAGSGAVIATLSDHLSYVESVAFSPSGEHLASGSSDKTVRLWNAVTGAHITTLPGRSGEVGSVAFSPDGKYLASTSGKTIRLWSTSSNSHIVTLDCHSDDVGSVAFSHNSTLLASGSHDGIIQIWKVPPEELTNLQEAMFTSDSLGLSYDTANTGQDTATSVSLSVQLNNDITESVSLESSTLIGFGGFGELFLGVHKEHGKVALKKPRRLLDETLVRRFLREVDLWCSVSHQYILPCLGMCRVGSDVYVVSPFIENGDLLSCMTRGKDLNRSKLLFEVAEALTHLHHRGIVHGDVKAQNILLGNDGSALLCDFGLAKAFDTMATSTEVEGAGSVRWMAPELFLGESRSMASDVYSLGITIAEVLSGHAPYHDLTEAFAVMFHVVNFGGRPPKEPLSGPEGQSYAILWEMAEKCWVKDVKARPHMAQVLGMLFPLTRAT